MRSPIASTTILSSIAIASLAFATLSAEASVLAIDDGSSEKAYGVIPSTTNAGDYTTAGFINAFSVPTESQVISVQIAFGSPNRPENSLLYSNTYLNSRSITAYVWSDPNGDGIPDDAQVLGQVTGTTAAWGTDTFIKFDLATPVTLSGNFFVGYFIDIPARYSSDGSLIGVSDDVIHPGALDTTNGASAAWSFMIGTDNNTQPVGLDPDNLLAHDSWQLNNASLVNPGVWLIRPEVIAVPEPTTTAILGIAALAGFFHRRRNAKRTASNIFLSRAPTQ